MKIAVKIIMAVLIAILLLMTVVFEVFAQDPPDSTPTIVNKWAWRHVLEDDDLLIIVYENTPYATTPDIAYSEAFIWRLIDTDGVTEIGQTLGYDYFELGYGYNVIGFYFEAADNITWEEDYYIRLSGTPSVFDEPPVYNFQLVSTDYSSLSDGDEIKSDIESKILQIANDLDNRWGLSVDYSLLSQSEVGMVLSIYGEAFFRGALYGLQSYAPGIFRLVIGNIDASMLADRTWADEYSTNLTAATQFPGSNIETGMQAGNDLLDVSYNLFGLLLTMGLIAIVVIICLMIGGDWWGSIAGGIAPMIICTRLSLFGMGELALVAAICWLFFTAKMWKLI